MKAAALIILTHLPEKNGVIAPLLPAGTVSVGQRMIASFQAAGICPVAVVTGPEEKKCRQNLAGSGVLFLENPHFETGSRMDSVRIGLRFLMEKFDRILVTPGDVPLFDPETVKALLRCEASLAVPVYSRMHGYPICLDRLAAGKLMEDRAAKTLEEAAASCPVEKREISVPDPGVVIRAEGLEQKKEAIARHSRKLLRPAVSVCLNGEMPLYDERLSALLHLVDETHSVRLSCSLMQMSYSAAWNMLNSAEDALGFPLIERIRGGTVGGSILTEKGRKLMQAYDGFSGKIRERAEEAFAVFLQENTEL